MGYWECVCVWWWWWGRLNISSIVRPAPPCQVEDMERLGQAAATRVAAAADPLAELQRLAQDFPAVVEALSRESPGALPARGLLHTAFPSSTAAGSAGCPRWPPCREPPAPASPRPRPPRRAAAGHAAGAAELPAPGRFLPAAQWPGLQPAGFQPV